MGDNKRKLLFLLKLLKHTSRCHAKFTGASKRHMLEQGARMSREIAEALRSEPALSRDKEVSEARTNVRVAEFVRVAEADRVRVDAENTAKAEKERAALEYADRAEAEARRKTEEACARLYSGRLSEFDEEE
jgi:hypothetical protein